MLQNSAQLFLNPFCFQIFKGIKVSKNVKEGVGSVQCLIFIHLTVSNIYVFFSVITSMEFVFQVTESSGDF